MQTERAGGHMDLYLVRRDRWYSERTTWGIAGAVITAATLLAWQVHPAFAWLIGVTGACALTTGFTGRDPVSTALVNLGMPTFLGEVTGGGRWRSYRMRTDAWYLERGIYLVVGTTQSIASVLSVVHSPWWLAFTAFVGLMSIGFAWSGFCPVANVLYQLGLEPRLAPPTRRPSLEEPCTSPSASTPTTAPPSSAACPGCSPTPTPCT